MQTQLHDVSIPPRLYRKRRLKRSPDSLVDISNACNVAGCNSAIDVTSRGMFFNLYVHCNEFIPDIFVGILVRIFVNVFILKIHVYVYWFLQQSRWKEEAD